MNKGYAFGFLIVLLVLVLGLYVAYTGFMSSREALRAQPTSSSGGEVGQATSAPTEPLPTATATILVLVTPTPELALTLPATVPPPTESPPTEPSAPAPTEPPPVPPADTPTPVAPPPTPVPAPAFQFRLGGPPAAAPDFPSCCYILGTVRDAAGNGLEGVQVQAFNAWNELPPAVTKGGGELGKYDIIIGRDPVTWYVVVVDAAGNRISSQAEVPFDPNVANGYRVDWQRTY